MNLLPSWIKGNTPDPTKDWALPRLTPLPPPQRSPLSHTQHAPLSCIFYLSFKKKTKWTCWFFNLLWIFQCSGCICALHKQYIIDVLNLNKCFCTVGSPCATCFLNSAVRFWDSPTSTCTTLARSFAHCWSAFHRGNALQFTEPFLLW